VADPEGVEEMFAPSKKKRKRKREREREREGEQTFLSFLWEIQFGWP
jgi:hypothetical protein